MNRTTKLTLATLFGAALVLGLTGTADAQPAVKVHHKTVKVGDLDIFYREAGPKDAPAILLLHGFPTSSQMFCNLIPQLADKYRVTATADGQPYVQYRGGTPGFLKVTDEHTLGFADFGGNRQYLTLGNLSENPKAFLFLMDYANRRRVKVWGTARVVEGDAALLEKLSDPAYPGKAERAILFTVGAWDVNCPRHIHERYSRRQIAPVVEDLRKRIAELEAEVGLLRANATNTN